MLLANLISMRVLVEHALRDAAGSCADILP